MVMVARAPIMRAAAEKRDLDSEELPVIASRKIERAHISNATADASVSRHKPNSGDGPERTPGQQIMANRTDCGIGQVFLRAFDQGHIFFQ
jgi:hypothetical protein